MGSGRILDGLSVHYPRHPLENVFCEDAPLTQSNGAILVDGQRLDAEVPFVVHPAQKSNGAQDDLIAFQATRCNAKLGQSRCKRLLIQMEFSRRLAHGSKVIRVRKNMMRSQDTAVEEAKNQRGQADWVCLCERWPFLCENGLDFLARTRSPHSFPP